ncbi:zinc-binding alcohol dehydrogenase family protein [Telmatocola sphagniphila]|uniref:Zinc-binding alcohol dehydrogenase family protein n=1 Tax=Telmatocola sphagniphila TaxID=1123043 RepID=A0A8E6EVV6_9BACT|nr:zinc-binding alcohol dehydrogenase family protein [Telmatocola sphagniphila]QVL29858.1 zinc-binding alcohol dehydrogenase family protein [Telmatocola sphagniphila]
MKAIQLEKPFEFRTIEIPEPGKPAAGEALVQVHRIGICGTDYSGYQGKMPFYSYPRIPGHELGVEVLDVGSEVKNVMVGDRCSIEPYINDPNSYASRNGHPNCCENLQVLGVHTDGGMRPRFIVPARKLHVAKSLSWEQLALVETLAIGCHAAYRGDCKPGLNVLIIGAGPIGLATLEFVKLAGSRPIMLDMNEKRLEFCKSTMGVKDTILSKGTEEDVKALQSLTNGHLAEVVIDATGNNKSMSNALNYVAFAGKLVFVGITTQEISFLHPLMHRREMTLLASRNALPQDFGNIIRLIEEGKINTKPWITHHAGLSEMIGVFPSWLKPETGVIKAIVAVEG